MPDPLPARATRAILDRLEGQHPNADTELAYRTAFELLIATILSAQSTDARVNEVTPALFARFPDAAHLAGASPAEVERLIVSTGFFRQKARSIITTSRLLVERHDGEVPAEMDALTSLTGVGRKTANVVLGHALGIPGFPVDRHVLRVANRLGIAVGDDPESVEAELCAKLPKERWTRASDTLILHGRRVCRPTPACDRCAANTLCRVLHGAWRHADRTGARHASGAATCHEEQARHEETGAAASMTRPEFEALVRDALSLIPRTFRERFENVEVVVEDTPPPELLAEMGYESGETLFGLYHGTPLTERGWAHGNALPDRIVIYQRPLEDAFPDPDEMFEEVCLTLIHEAGHYFGLGEDEIEAIEDEFWYSGGELGDPDKDED